MLRYMLFLETVIAKKTALMERILRRKTRERILIHCMISEFCHHIVWYMSTSVSE
jgi:hypothetical protein